MGLLSLYMAYRLGRRSERREEASWSVSDETRRADRHCVNYDYCSARGACLDLVECEYE